MDGRIAAISGAAFGGVLLAGALGARPAANLNPFSSTDAPAVDTVQAAPDQQDTGIPAGVMVAVATSERSYGDEQHASAQDEHDQSDHGDHGERDRHDHDDGEHDKDD